MKATMRSGRLTVTLVATIALAVSVLSATEAHSWGLKDAQAWKQQRKELLKRMHDGARMIKEAVKIMKANPNPSEAETMMIEGGKKVLTGVLTLIDYRRKITGTLSIIDGTRMVTKAMKRLSSSRGLTPAEKMLVDGLNTIKDSAKRLVTNG